MLTSITADTPRHTGPRTPVPSRGDRAPTVSIIIPAHNEEDTIGRCIEAALAQTLPAWEIIVVDNCSTDGTASIVTQLARQHPDAGIRLLTQSDELGLVPTRNLGFAHATGEVLGRIDADSLLEPDWVAHVAHTMTDPRIAAVTGPVTYYDLALRGLDRTSDDLIRRTLRRLGKSYPFLYGSNMAIRARAWHRIEPDACRDLQDLYHEDIDLAVHLYEAGLAATYLSGMRASVSARRLSSSPGSFRDYTRRFERTYTSHGIDDWHLRVPQVLLQHAYWWARVLHAATPTPRQVAS
ncbi:glycosyltransferase family 2 protein [Leucobacter weissii]|uniref:Glycosyltransferase family 2 protein n=1 Tax=Leucobacter weissii TaxID=1983706 RepID=A0A939SB03_9MICO|nr:glycosyltransferase family 2 protein [Leucobacter weissii]MBO1902487.1 glycosyltransferase family 2 protein [Leucobacter weissii]